MSSVRLVDLLDGLRSECGSVLLEVVSVVVML